MDKSMIDKIHEELEEAAACPVSGDWSGINPSIQSKLCYY